MELYKEILAQILSQQNAQIIFPDLRLDTTKIVEAECYKSLQKIEEVVCIFEEMGSSGGGRHDFG